MKTVAQTLREPAEQIFSVLKFSVTGALNGIFSLASLCLVTYPSEPNFAVRDFAERRNDCAVTFRIGYCGLTGKKLFRSPRSEPHQRETIGFMVKTIFDRDTSHREFLL